MKELLLGLDVGTTATKATLFDLQGKLVASASHGYRLNTPKSGWVEQDPEALWRGVVETIRSVVEQIDGGDRIAALSLSSQGGSTIPVDANNQPIHPAISWMDARASEQARRVRETWGADFIHRATGWYLTDGLPLQHISWLREHRPDIFRAAQRFLFVNDFILHRLTGELCMNPSDAGITQLFSIAAADWDEQLLEIAGITRDQLAPLRPSGDVVALLRPTACEATGLRPDTLVVNGAHDQYCAAVGTGTTQPGSVLLSCGTAWVVLAIPESLEMGLRSGMSISRHALPDSWGAIRSLGGVGTSLEWFLDAIWGRSAGASEQIYSDLNSGVSQAPAGANGVLFFPLTGGHGAEKSGVGGFHNLTLTHTKNDLARAVMEGVAYELCWAMDEMLAAGLKIDEFKMVGGAAESDVWPQIIADVTGVPVILPTVKQAAGRGAAILAGVGAGVWPDPDAGFLAFRGDETRLSVDPANHARYQTFFNRYQKTWRQCTS